MNSNDATAPSVRELLRLAARGRKARAACAAAALVLGVLIPSALSAQTLTSSLFRGTVLTSAGEPVENARVVVEDQRTGLVRSQRTDDSGRFMFRLLPAGDYVAFAEKLGYRPRLVHGVALRPGRSLDMSLSIAPAEPPVVSVDSVAYSISGVGWSRAGVSRWFGELEIDAPRDGQRESSLVRLSTKAGEDLAIEGLPAFHARSAPEGFSFAPVMSRGAGERDANGARGLGSMEGAELITNLPDVEWAGSAGAQLVTYSRRGTRDFSARSWGTGSDAITEFGRFSADAASTYDLARAGAEFSGPVIADTALFLVGGEWRRRARLEPRAWRQDELAGAQVGSSARDDAELSLLALTLPAFAQHDEMSAWGRFDWRVAPAHEFAGFADFSMSRAAESLSPLRATPDYAFGDETLDIVGGGTLRSILSPRFANELRAGVARSTADNPLPGELTIDNFSRSGIATTSVLDGALRFGADPMRPSFAERTAVQVEQALIIGLGGHMLKLGVVADWNSRTLEYAFARAGAFTFGSPTGFASRTGAFLQTIGTLPEASFSTLETGAFLQDTWRPAPGVELVAGVRMTDERLPTDGAQPNVAWLALTGLDNTASPGRARQFSPRLGFLWNVRDRNQWIVRAGFGMYHDDVSADILAEHQTHDGGLRVRRAFGDLGRWPEAPDSSAAPVQGPLLTLLDPDFRPPRSTRASFGLSRIGSTSLHLSASYRHTDFLPARRDLNRLPSATAFDQYGRPIYGDLLQQGSMLGVAPGSNRRFGAFDIVSGVEANAFSDYWDATALVERRVARRLRFVASYTYSRTRDDWYASSDGAPFAMFAPQLSDSASASDWAEGVSDFDVPHRVSLTTELGLPLPLTPTLGIVYRAQSALPFTPGFQPGVDANGDYAANDPAFIDDSLDGMAGLLDEWSCLRDQAGTFAERNSCRGEALHFLDARLALVLGFGVGARVYLDAINLLRTELARPDAALLLVDPDGSIDIDENDASLAVPLMVNPRFGQPVRSIESGRILRIGAEVFF